MAKRIESTLSISSLLQRLLLATPPRANRDSNEDDTARIGTTVRLEPNVKHFIEHQASHLGISSQDFISLTLRSVMIASEAPQLSEFDVMVSRFFELFAAHKIATADIPLFLPPKTLKRSEIQNRDSIIDAMNDETVKHLSNLFWVNPDWLRGVDVPAVSSNVFDWDSSIQPFARKLFALRNDGTVESISVLFARDSKVSLSDMAMASKDGYEAREVKITPILRVGRSVNGRSVHVFDKGRKVSWNHETSRLDLKLMMLLCERSAISFGALLLSTEQFDKLEHYHDLPANTLNTLLNTQYIDELLWDNERNPEREELPWVVDRFEKRELGVFVEAILNPWLVANPDDVINGRAHIVFKDVNA